MVVISYADGHKAVFPYDPDFGRSPRYRSDCVWIVPGTVDPDEA